MKEKCRLKYTKTNKSMKHKLTGKKGGEKIKTGSAKKNMSDLP